MEMKKIVRLRFPRVRQRSTRDITHVQLVFGEVEPIEDVICFIEYRLAEYYYLTPKGSIVPIKLASSETGASYIHSKSNNASTDFLLQKPRF